MRRQILTLLAIAAVLPAVAFGVQEAGLVELAGALVFFIALGVSFTRGPEALYLIVASIMFSPELSTGLSTGRTWGGEGSGGIVLRFEDVVLVAVGVGWLLRTAYQNRSFGIILTPANRPIIAYMVVSVAATLWGVMAGRVVPLAGLIHNLKYFEYFFLFFMILAHVRDLGLVSRIIRFALVMFFLAVLYGYTQIDPAGSARVCAPFDAEPNTFGGYMVLMMCVVFGMLQFAASMRMLALSAGLLLLAVPPFLFTLSRSSYMAMASGLLAFLVFSPRRLAVAWMIVGMMALALLGAQILPQKVYNRITQTFQKEEEYHVEVAGVSLDASASARIESYRKALDVWQDSPLLGKGVTGVHFIDGQYFRLLAEIGILGLAAFALVLFRLIAESRRIFLACEDPFLRGAAMGFLCAIFALMAHAVSANTFIIVRIAEPFWLLAGLLLLIPHLARTQKEPAGEQPAAAAAASPQ